MSVYLLLFSTVRPDRVDFDFDDENVDDFASGIYFSVVCVV